MARTANAMKQNRRRQRKNWHRITRVAQESPRCQLAHGAASCPSQKAWLHNQNSTALARKII